MNKLYTIGILGKSGYVGQELITLIKTHPHMQLLDVEDLDDVIKKLDHINILFLATPPAISIKTVAALKDTNINIIDLSGAFRLNAIDFSNWYQLPHPCSDLIKDFYYGLVPWQNDQANYKYIANPGCYATAALLAILPLLNQDFINTKHIIIDAKSGVSGAGKQLNAELMFCEVANNFFPYKVGNHQHTPEIKSMLSAISKQEIDISLTTSILPIVRGISMAIYFEAQAYSDEEITALIADAYQKVYQNYSLVNFSPISNKKILNLKEVVNTPFCNIGFHVKNGHITIFSSIDNLLKGAASQAIENFNAMQQLPLTTGLINMLEAA